MKFFKNKFLKTILIVFIFDLLFFYSLIIPNAKSLITPELGGGDNFLVALPYQYQLCKNIKNFKLPFWSKHMSLGYPLLAEGEIGAFNPINILSCFISDYKNALNWQIILNNLIGQIGILVLGSLLGLSIYSSIFFALIFSFSPFVLMNYMHFSFIRSIMFLPYILIGLVQFYRQQRFKFFVFTAAAVGMQFVASHFQISFISICFILIYLSILLWFSSYSRSKKIIIFFKFLLSIIVGLSLVGFQLLPAIEFYRNSSRSTDVYAVKSDQGLSINHLLTFLNPYFLGNPKIGTYPFAQSAHPWEGTLFIYYIGLTFLVIFIFSYKKIKNIYLNAFLISLLIIFLIALGQNSPFYLIHYLPPFSAFRFPSRFVFILIFIISLFSSKGFDYLINSLKMRSKLIIKLILLITFVVIFYEIKLFFNNFHVIKSNSNMFIPSSLIGYLKSQPENRYFYPVINLISISQRYVIDGYKQNSDIYYQVSNASINPNINLIYELTSFNNKVGPQLKRFSYLESLILSSNNPSTDQSSTFSEYANGVLYSAGIKYIISLNQIKSEMFQLEQQFLQPKLGAIYLYKLKDEGTRIKFFLKAKSIATVSEFKDSMSDNSIYTNTVILEKNNLNFNNISDNFNHSYQVINDSDSYLSIKTSTNQQSIFYLADTYYPGWVALVNKKPTKIMRANLYFRAIELPKGKNIVEFVYRPKSFYLGMILSVFTGGVLVLYLFIKRVLKRL